jgi:mannose-6-phosphate isomerase-like protein (cupin superfamily)
MDVLRKPLMTYRVIRWKGEEPTEDILREMMEAEGLRPYTWSNSPGDQYSVHQHGYDKVIFVVTGSITFGLPEVSESVKLHAGDRLDLPAGLMHDASVGPEGVRCLEGHH